MGAIGVMRGIRAAALRFGQRLLLSTPPIPDILMADNGSSNVATVAIVVLVIIAAIALYFFAFRGGDAPAPDGPDVELNIGDGDGG